MVKGLNAMTDTVKKSNEVALALDLVRSIKDSPGFTDDWPSEGSVTLEMVLDFAIHASRHANIKEPFT